MKRMGSIPIVEVYRGVGIHDQQPQDRINHVVKPEIDEVITNCDNLPWLFVYCGDVTKAPEARLLAAALCKSIFQLSVSERRERPSIDITLVEARVAGLESETWRCPWTYGTLMAPGRVPGQPGAVRREVPLDGESKF